MGTPEWAIPPLETILDSGSEISAVFTQPDRPFGRKRQLKPSPVKQIAQEQNLKVYTPEKAGSPETLELVRALVPELILVCAYGQILAQSFLDIPRIGCFNLHFSFLPKLRGASPVQTAISSGFKTSGVSLQKMILRLDAGALVAASGSETILPDDTTPLLGSRLAEIGGKLIRETLPKLHSELKSNVNYVLLRLGPEYSAFTLQEIIPEKNVDFSLQKLKLKTETLSREKFIRI